MASRRGPRLTPREAATLLTRNKVDYLPISEIEGRIATTLFVVYPPGIATIGYETDTQGGMIDRLKAAGVELVVDVRAVASSRKAGSPGRSGTTSRRCA